MVGMAIPYLVVSLVSRFAQGMGPRAVLFRVGGAGIRIRTHFWSLWANVGGFVLNNAKLGSRTKLGSREAGNAPG